MNVFYSPSTATVIDYAVQIGGETIGYYSRKSIGDIDREYPDFIIVDTDKAAALVDAFYTLPPVKVSREDYIEALECLPPVDWTALHGSESFKMSERVSGNVTAIYVRINQDHYKLYDNIRLSHAEIIEKVLNYLN